MEKGELQSVRVVVDNPHVQVLLQLDEYRNKDPDGESAAEIIYNGNSDTANRGFKILDGQGSGKGYVMEYRPDVPEPYEQRVRLIIRNQIRRSGDVYGMDLSYQWRFPRQPCGTRTHGRWNIQPPCTSFLRIWRKLHKQ